MTRAPLTLPTQILAFILLIGTTGVPAHAQRLLDHSPNTRSTWTMARWQPAMIISHRFEFLSGGDELLNVPLVTVGTAVHERIAIGLDFTSNSEVTAARLGGNETQWWLALRGPAGARGGVDGLIGYNTAAGSVDGAITTRARTGPVSLVAEARGFSNAFGTQAAGFAGAGGAVLHLTPYLSLAGDLGRVFRPDTLGTVWSGGFTLAIPGTRHQLSLHATNGGAATLQGASRENILGPKAVRYGFAFVAPLGTGAQWGAIFRRANRAAAPTETARMQPADTIRVAIRNLVFSPDTVRIPVGATVLWENADPIVHTVTADDGRWGSATLETAARYTHRFTAAGRFPYHCAPHPHMKGVVIVEP